MKTEIEHQQKLLDLKDELITELELSLELLSKDYKTLQDIIERKDQ